MGKGISTVFLLLTAGLSIGMLFSGHAWLAGGLFLSTILSWWAGAGIKGSIIKENKKQAFVGIVIGLIAFIAGLFIIHFVSKVLVLFGWILPSYLYTIISFFVGLSVSYHASENQKLLSFAKSNFYSIAFFFALIFSLAKEQLIPLSLFEAGIFESLMYKKSDIQTVEKLSEILAYRTGGVNAIADQCKKVYDVVNPRVFRAFLAEYVGEEVLQKAMDNYYEALKNPLPTGCKQETINNFLENLIVDTEDYKKFIPKVRQ